METTGTFSLSEAKNILQGILDKQFASVPEKRKIITRQKEFAMACPICHDSFKNMSKKRGTLYFDSFRYRCFNCGEKKTLLGLIKEFEIYLDPEKRLQIIDYVSEATQRVRFSEEDFITNDLDKMIDLDILTEWFNTNPSSPIRNFRPVEKNSKIWKYLTSRKIFDFENIYEASFKRTEKWYEDVLVNLNQKKGKVIGMQLRNLTEDRNKRMYKIYSFTELWAFLHEEEMDEIDAIGYNKLSYLYNILNVDWERPITIFEGFLDTKFFPNSIGCVGTNTDLKFILNQETDIRFFYDYDKTGVKKSLEMLNEGYPVFLWEKLFDFWSSNTKDPNRAGRELRKKVVDLNHVAKLVPNPYSKMKLENFFAKDEMDLIFIKTINSPETK